MAFTVMLNVEGHLYTSQQFSHSRPNRPGSRMTGMLRDNMTQVISTLPEVTSFESGPVRIIRTCDLVQRDTIDLGILSRGRREEAHFRLIGCMPGDCAM
jgi:hypothetical protein